MVFTDATQGLFFAGTLWLWDSISGHTGGQMDILLPEGQGAEMPLLTHSQDSNGGGPASSHLL